MGQLRDRMVEDLKLKGLSPATQNVYLTYCRKFAVHFRCCPTKLGEAEIRQFLMHALQIEQVSYQPVEKL